VTAVVALSDVERFRGLVLTRLGLHFDDTKLPFLADVIRDRMAASGTSQVQSYLERVSEIDRAEIRALASHLTVGETYFFRYWDHFRAFNDLALAEVARRSAGATRLRVLSAGCASGEEAYTLAILVREHLPDLGSSIKIHGVDVNPGAIEKALRGRYSSWSLREAPPELRARHFRADGREYELTPAVREMVSFEERNLVQDDSQFWREDAFDIIFCRNVMMYFAPDVMSATVARLARALRPGGYLFLGHAETLRGVSQDFHLCHTHGCFYYRRKQAAERGDLLHQSLPTPRTPSVVDPLLPDVSWFEAIQRASDRITRLVPERHASTGTPNATVSRLARLESSPPDLAPAVELVRAERFDAAMELLQALPPHSAADPDALLLRAVVLTNSGQLAAAAETCNEILRRDELSSGAHYLIALSCEHNGDSAGALEHDRIAAYLDSKFAMPRLHLGLLARRAGELDEARTQLHLALGLLVAEDPSRILLFGGGFNRDALLALCRSELRRCGGPS